MGDIFSKEKRSEIMSNVRTEGTDIEEILGECVKTFWENHRYRKNDKDLPGTPDVVFTKRKIAIFADGDFWHGRNFEEWKTKVSDFWVNKIEKNRERDKRQTKELKEMGYTVIRFWGSDLKKKDNEEIIEKIGRALEE